MRASPRRATTRTVSASIASVRSPWTTRPSALLTIFDVTTMMSPSSEITGGPGDQRGEVGARPDFRDPGHAPDADLARGPGRPPVRGHQASSAARPSAARAISAVAARSRMYRGMIRTSIPASAGSAAAALSSSSTSHPSMSPAP